MSKKLIAVASAAAIALSALVAVPAQSATAFAVDLDSTVYAGHDLGSSATSSIDILVPSDNVLEDVGSVPASDNTATGTLARFEVDTTDASANVSVTSTGGVKLLEKDDVVGVTDAPTVKSGKTSLALKAATNATEFYAFTTSTTAGSFTVTQGGNSKTVYVKGVENGNPYSLKLTGPSFVATSNDATFSGTVTDAFGNALTEGLVYGTDVEITVAGATYKASSWEYASKKWSFKVTAGAIETPIAVSVSIKGFADNIEVEEFGAGTPSQFFSLNGTDLAAAIKILEAKIATMRPIADSVTQRKYNKLARKWNAAFPGQKVALKK